MAAEFLIDDYLDGRVEERAWVSVDVASTPEQAVQWITTAPEAADIVATLASDGFTLAATGTRAWYRPLAKLDADELWQDAQPWWPCPPDAPGAVEFWDLEVVEVDGV